MVLPLTALVLVVLVLFVAFAVDLGRASLRVREQQSIADAVSLDLARQLDGRTKDEISSDPVFLATVTRSTDANEFPVSSPSYGGSTITAASGDRQLTVELGRMSVPAGAFEPAFTSIAGTEVPDAVRVVVGDTTDYEFWPGGTTDDRTAVAERAPQVWLQIGSVAAGFDANPPGSVGLSETVFVEALNAQVTAAFSVNGLPQAGAGLDVFGYQGMAAADANLEDIAANSGFATADEMTESSLTAGQFFDATIIALQNEGDAASAQAAAEMANFRNSTNFDSNAQINLGDSIRINDGAVVSGDINVLDLLALAGQAINSKNLLDFSFDSGIPGVGVINGRAAIIERSQRTYGPRGSTARTAQMRYQLNLQIDPAAFGIVGVSTPISLPMVVDVARATATTDFVNCADPLVESTTQSTVVTSALTAQIGTAVDLTTPGAVTVDEAVLIEQGDIALAATFFLNLGIPALTGDFTAEGTASLGGGTDTLPLFEHFDPTNQGPKRSLGGFDANIGTDLAAAMSTNAGPGATSQLTSDLSSLFDLLSQNVINPLQQYASMSVGGADVSMYEDDIADDCAVPVLVD